jgi:hypothetical protein
MTLMLMALSVMMSWLETYYLMSFFTFFNKSFDGTSPA